MAGGKETPRQKMIGMMYLVLTALLALQVSNAVLEKFAIIQSTLEKLIVDTSKKNVAQVNHIIAEAGKSTNPKVVSAKERAQKVRELTQTTINNIDVLKKEMMKVSGSDQINEKLINDHSSKVATMMMDQKSPTGKNFEKTLKDYVRQLEELSGLKFETLAKAPKDMPIFANDEDHARKDFLTFTFENTPVIAALASVTQIQTEILEYESEALTKLAEEANAGTIRFDNIVPMVRAKQSIVAAGAKFEGEMFVAASSSSFTPEFFMDSKKLETVDQSGIKMGKVEFVASGGGYDASGLAKKTFLAEIKMSDTTYRLPVEYFVAAPVIKVTTGNAPTLYMNCGNDVNIEVPALGTNYNPTFNANGAKVIKGDKPGKVTIIPTQRKIAVAVSNGGANLGSVNFDVRQIPNPRYVAKDNTGKEIDMRNGVRGAALTGLRIAAEADENFKQEVPKDATYRIRSMDVIHARGTSPVNRMTSSNEIVDLNTWRSQFRAGDMIVVDIKTVTRRTYEGQDERVEVKSEIIRIPIQ